MVNDVIDEKYQIISKIGSGGTSNVYKALRLSDEKIVAIKVIREGLEDSKEYERHFRLEAEALSQMAHKNVRRIYSIGRWNDALYMVTEFIDGETLKDIITKNGPVPIKTALDYALQIIAGIEHAHRKNIIHRDIKPQNVLVSRDGTIKLVDFGIARVLSHDTRTVAGKDVEGSVHYISPEQAQGNEVDMRSDIYSFGVLLYELFCGTVPFSGAEAVSIAMKHVNEIPVSPNEKNPSVPKGINDIILKCIQKNPDSRYQSASEVREDLLLFVADPEHFRVLQNRHVSDFEENDPDVPVRKRNISDKNDVYENDGKAKNSFVVEDPKMKQKFRKRRKIFIIAAFAVASAIIISIAVSIIIPLTEKNATYAIHNVPPVAGLAKSGAVAVLRADQFSKFDFKEEPSAIIAEGEVIRTEPSEGSAVEVNTVITVYLSSGPKKITAESVVGKNIDEATSALKEQGFTVTYDYSEDSAKADGTVIAQTNEGKELSEGATVTLTVVRNVKTLKLTVPNLKGMSVDQAKNAIESAGFKVGRCTQVKVDSNENLGVTWQSVNPGEEYPYMEGNAVPSVTIDFSVNVCNSYKCTYSYKTEDEQKLDLELIVYDSKGNQIGYEKYNDVSNVDYEFSGATAENITFELYTGNQRLNKQVIMAEKSVN